MRTSSELLLTFLLNACWQVALIAAVASLGSWLLRNSSARFRHWIWVAALLLSFSIPLVASARVLLDLTTTQPDAPGAITFERHAAFVATGESSPISAINTSTSAIELNSSLAFALIAIYVVFTLSSVFRFYAAWSRTRTIKRTAESIVVKDAIAGILEKCQTLIGTKQIQLLCSSSMPVPVTMGARKPVIILPEQLVRDGDANLLTSAIGHEAIHVARRDYILNLLYELMYLPLSFHPAAALIRRRIKQTRELCCDERVAQTVLEPAVYARSLVTLASTAPPFSRLSATATVGIADADILEVRIMSLMKKSKLEGRSRKALLIVVALLLAVPSVAAAALAMRFNVDAPGFSAQEQEQKEKEKRIEKEKQESREFRAGVAAGKEELKRRRSDNSDFEPPNWREEEELKARDIMQASLVRLARIPMDQAIQVALSQQPGKVLQSSLGAEGWEELGKLGKDGKVFYHIIVLSGDENSPLMNHVWVNAIDGTVMKVEKELPRKMRREEP